MSSGTEFDLGPFDAKLDNYLAFMVNYLRRWARKHATVEELLTTVIEKPSWHDTVEIINGPIYCPIVERTDEYLLD